MNFTILVVALVLTQATTVEAGCTAIKVGGEDRLRCMNGGTTYGYLTYSAYVGERYGEYRTVADEYHYLEISVLQAFEGGEATITALLNYLIDHIAKKNGFQQIKLSGGDQLAVRVFKNKFKGIDDPRRMRECQYSSTVNSPNNASLNHAALPITRVLPRLGWSPNKLYMFDSPNNAILNNAALPKRGLFLEPPFGQCLWASLPGGSEELWVYRQCQELSSREDEAAMRERTPVVIYIVIFFVFVFFVIK